MSLRFLRQFAQFRALELELQRERDNAARAAYDLREMMERCDALHDKIERLSEQLVLEAHKVTDVFSVHAIGKRVYTKADAPPVGNSAPSMPVAPGRTFARAAQSAQTAETREELLKMWNAVS